MIHQLVHTLSYGDAISGEVIALQRIFRSVGQESEIYCLNTHPAYKGKTKELSQFPKDFSGSLILHYSLGSPLNAVYESSLSQHKYIIFHNLTPSYWFEGINPRIVHDIENGRKELPHLLTKSNVIISDSHFNALELQAMGHTSQVLSLMCDPDRWNIQRNTGFYSLLKNDGKAHLLHVGRIAPNKCIEDLLKVFYFYHHYCNGQSKLWLAGIDTDTEIYSFALRRLLRELSLEDSVEFLGGISDGELKSLYEASTMYLCMSEHEGFCLPIVEAMHFGLPVVSFSSSALSETVGNGGVLCIEKKFPEIATTIHHIHQDRALYEMLQEKGRARARDFSYTHFEQNVKIIFGL